MRSKSFPWFGVLLIVGGTVLLLDRLFIIQFGFARILWAAASLVGVLHAAGGFSSNNRGRIFWGTIVFLYGVYFLLRTFDPIEFYPHLFVPATMLIFGAAFFVMYLNNYREWFLLVPSLVLLGMGTAILFGQIYDFWEVWWSVRRYWPVVLILIGLSLILKSQAKRQKSV